MHGPRRKPSGAVWLATLLIVLTLGAHRAGAAVPAHGRAWELVTSGPTNGVRLLDERAWTADGDRVVYASAGPMPGAASGDIFASGLATRGASGWTQQPIGEPFSVSTPDLGASQPLTVDPGLSSWLWSSSQPLVPGAPPAPQVGIYRRDPDGSLALLGPAGDILSFQFVGASEDLRHAVFQSGAHLLTADAARNDAGDVYEYVGTQLRLVALDDAGALISTCGSEVGDGDAAHSTLLHAISRDGTRIFLSAPVATECGIPRGVYLRADGAHTTEISASACDRPDCDAPQDATFAGALPDGSSAFLVTAQQLTDDDTDESPDLYRYDVAARRLTRLSAGPPGVAAAVSDASIRFSDDGTRVYFVALGALVPGAGVQDSPNLYLSDHGQLRFVGPADGVDLRTAAISSDGRVLTFATSARLLPSDTDDNVDVYRYDAVTDTLTEVSRGDGDRGNGPFDVTFGTHASPNPLQPEGMRYMSADGSRVLFVTSEPLVADDVNATPDVYEWADGTLGLVSSGVGDATMVFGGLSADGRSAFFSTDETLVAADRNNGDEDVYDARLGGGFSAASPPPPDCEGDACQGPPGGRLGRAAPASLTHVEPPAPRVRVRPLDRRARRALALTGRTALVVDVPAAGRVSLVGYATLHRRATVVARDAVTARGAASVRLHVRLTSAARRLLRRGHRLRLRLVVRVPGIGAAPALGVTLERTP